MIHSVRLEAKRKSGIQLLAEYPELLSEFFRGPRKMNVRFYGYKAFSPEVLVGVGRCKARSTCGVIPAESWQCLCSPGVRSRAGWPCCCFGMSRLHSCSCGCAWALQGQLCCWTENAVTATSGITLFSFWKTLRLHFSLLSNCVLQEDTSSFF